MRPLELAAVLAGVALLALWVMAIAPGPVMAALDRALGL